MRAQIPMKTRRITTRQASPAKDGAIGIKRHAA
jgi:hypothetical protein